MLFVFIILWLVAFILILSDPRKSTIRWLSGVTLCGGFGALSALIGDTLIPYAMNQHYSNSLLSFLDKVRILCSLTQYYGLPYMYLLFAISYRPTFISPDRKRMMAWLLLLPIAAMFLFVRPIHPIHYPLTSLWTVPYIFIGSVLILGKKETNFTLRRNHHLLSLAIIPAIVYAAVMNYILPSLGMLEMWRYNVWMVGVAFVIFLFAIFNYGFLDVQLLIQRKRLDLTIRAITSGTAILNHAIKNDVGKMKLFTEKIKAHAEETGQSELLQDVLVIQQAAQHIQDMITRVKGQTQDIVLKMAWHKPAEWLRQLQTQLAPYMAGIELHYQLQENVELYCDKTQVQEVFQNLVMNAIEAMPAGGNIMIKLSETGKWVNVEIKDTGHGIEKKQLEKVMEPFYTTKGSQRMNFGLGLSYCYQVMRLHHGNLRIQSEPGKGTSVFLNFPKKGGSKHGEHSRLDR